MGIEETFFGFFQFSGWIPPELGWLFSLLPKLLILAACAAFFIYYLRYNIRVQVKADHQSAIMVRFTSARVLKNKNTHKPETVEFTGWPFRKKDTMKFPGYNMLSPCNGFFKKWSLDVFKDKESGYHPISFNPESKGMQIIPQDNIGWLSESAKEDEMRYNRISKLQQYLPLLLSTGFIILVFIFLLIFTSQLEPIGKGMEAAGNICSNMIKTVGGP